MTTPNSNADNTIAHSVTITGLAGGARLTIEVDRTATGPAAFVDTNGEVQLDAAGLRRVAAACVEAADRLDNLTTADPS
jgi:hypothetical protein